MKTSTIKPSAPLWHIVDASGLTIGYICARVAKVLRGKHRPTFSPHQLCGDHVVIVNAAKLAVTPAKGRRKVYYDHTGYQGSLSMLTLTQMMEKSPEKVLEKAVRGMLPGNRLRPQMLKRLHVYAGGEHEYGAQKPSPLQLSKI